MSGEIESSTPSPSGFIKTVPARDPFEINAELDVELNAEPDIDLRVLNFKQGKWLEYYKNEGYNDDEAFRKALTR